MRSSLVLLFLAALVGCSTPPSNDGGVDAVGDTDSSRTDSTPSDSPDAPAIDTMPGDTMPLDAPTDTAPVDAPTMDVAGDDTAATDAPTIDTPSDDTVSTDADDAPDAAMDDVPDTSVVDVFDAGPPCSDGVVDTAAGEECDDHNTTAGDGCSPTCQLEAGYAHETEPNGTQATANDLGGSPGFIGAISPAGDADDFSFDVTVPGSSVWIEVSDGLGGCPAGFDSAIDLLSPAGAVLVHDDNGGVATCSRIQPIAYSNAANLAVGRYAVAVRSASSTSTAPLYVVTIRVVPAGCGDGIRQTGEQCDDANIASGDGCSSTCTFERSFVSETEPNDTQAIANPLGPFEGSIASIAPIGDIDFFSFDVTIPGSSVTIRTSDGIGGCPPRFDSSIDLFAPGGALLASNDDGDVAPCSLLSPATAAATAGLATGTYRVRVREITGVTTVPQYVVEIRVRPPGCGDAVLQGGEQCDDGNAMSGDGCSATCQSESPWEIEPNDSTATATPLWPGTTSWNGSISPAGDHDYYTFTLASTGAVTLATHDIGSATACSADTVLHLLNAAGTEIVQNDDGGIGTCSMISPSAYPAVGALPPGTYYVWVQEISDSLGIAGYALDLNVM